MECDSCCRRWRMSLACRFCKNRVLSAMNDSTLRRHNRRAGRSEAFDSWRGAHSFLAVPQGKGCLERAEGREKLADMHVLKVWPHHLKIVLLAMAPPRSPWTAARGRFAETNLQDRCLRRLDRTLRQKTCQSPESGQVRRDTCTQPAIPAGRSLFQLRFNLHLGSTFIDLSGKVDSLPSR